MTKCDFLCPLCLMGECLSFQFDRIVLICYTMDKIIKTDTQYKSGNIRKSHAVSDNAEIT